MASNKDAGTPREEETHELLVNKDNTEVDTHVVKDVNKADGVPGLPVDRGWAWMILLGAILEVFVYGGIMKSYGVYFVQFQQRFGSNASRTSLIQTVSNLSISFSGIFVMTVGTQHMTARTSICIGGVLTSISYAVSAFARHLEVLIFALGAVNGVAASMIFLPIINYIGIYFNKHRGMANSLNMAGASLGALVFGPLYSILFEHYGYTGTMLISSGLLLNILVTGCLMRPPAFFNKQNEHSTTTLKKECKEIYTDHIQMNKNGDFKDRHSLKATQINDMGHVVSNSVVQHQACLLFRTTSGPADDRSSAHTPHKRWLPDIDICSSRTRAYSFDPSNVNNNAITTKQAREGGHVYVRSRTVSEGNHQDNEPSETKPFEKTNIPLFSNFDSMCGSLVSLRSGHLHSNKDFASENEKEQTPSTESHTNSFKSKLRTFLLTVFDPSLIKDKVFLHFIVFSFVAFAPAIITPVYFVPFAKDIGISNDRINILLILIGCTDLISRISVGIFSDRKWLKPTTIVGMAFIMMCVIHNLSRLITSFWGMVIFVVIQSSLTGVYVALFAVILIENLGLEKFRSSLGFTNMSHGGSGAIFFPITGAMRDISGAYYWTYHLLSVLLLIGAALAFTLPIIYRQCRLHNTGQPAKERIVE